MLLLLLLLLSRLSCVRLCATPETAAHQAPPSLGFSRQEHWSGLPFPSPELGIFLITYGHHCKHAVLCCDSVMPCRALGMQSGLFSPTCNTVI